MKGTTADMANFKWTPAKARREAISCRNMQAGLHRPGEGMEYAYSPSTCAIGCRWEDEQEGSIFRVFNVYYPMYKRNAEVTDWVSVGVARPLLVPPA